MNEYEDIWFGMFLNIWWNELKLACFVMWYGLDDGSIRQEFMCIYRDVNVICHA